MPRWVRGVALALAALACREAFADDGVILQVDYGPAAGEVRLDWSGGQPGYDVYRSTSASAIVAPANKLGSSPIGPWLDTPPAGSIFYYRIVGPCLTPSAEACDGVDDDCDGFLDNGCPGACIDDGGCTAAESCDAATDHCVPDVADGQSCGRDEQCLADHCSNGVCCASGDCCTSAAQCAGYSWSLRCDDPSTCQGSTGTAACTGSFQCGSVTTGDDSACAGIVSQICGLYPSIACTSDVSQPANQAGLCAGSCVGDAACDAGGYCDATGHCAPDSDLGGFCSTGSQCQSGLCADGVCCNTLCSPGTCTACDIAGSVGTCSPAPAGQDPDAECPGVTCTGFYHSWSGDSCRRKADVSAAAASCSGDSACRTQPAECTAQTSVGPVVTTCNSLCQEPNLSTCTGTTAPVCTNINPGNQTCGLGQCANTVPQCANGAPNSCTPGSPTPETCNNLDDNCNGTIDDNSSFADGREPTSTVCPGSTLPTVGSDQTLTQNTLTLYPSGDVDYYRINATETDSTCGCGVFSFDEDYDLAVTLTVPAGAGSYQFCTDTACGTVSTHCETVLAGTAFTWTWNLDGECTPGTTDSYSEWFRISPLGAPGFECLPYTLSYFFNAGLCR